MKNFAKVSLTTFIDFCSMRDFSHPENVNPVGLDTTSQDYFILNSSKSFILLKQILIPL